MIKTQDIYWLAGLLEGEGCFTCQGGGINIAVGMTDRDVVEKAAGLLGGKLLSRIPKPDSRPEFSGGRKQIWLCKISGHRAAGWAMTLYSLMGHRRQERIKEVLGKWGNSHVRSVVDGKCLIHPNAEVVKFPSRDYLTCRACHNRFASEWRKRKNLLP